MAHLVERAPTGRAKCRGCEGLIAAGEQRFGERVANPYDEKGGDTTHWFHLACAALVRPEAFLETLSAASEPIEHRSLFDEARLGAAHPRLSRVRGAERASSGRATCRACREAIAKGAWRVALGYYEDGRFAPSGFIHLTCAQAYLETAEIVPRIKHFSPALSDDDIEEIRAALATV